MDESEMHTSITKFLYEFDYPGIQALSTEEIAQIFDKDNRFFFVTWMVAKINKKFLDKLKSIPVNKHKQYVSDVVSVLGACTESESLPFMNDELEIKQQLSIMMRLITLALKCQGCAKSLDVNSAKFMSEEELDSLCQPPKDLFQNQYYTGEDVLQKHFLAGDTESTSGENAVLENASKDIPTSSSPDKSVAAYMNLLQTLQKELPELTLFGKNLESRPKSDVNESTYKFPDRFPEMLRQMHEYIDQIKTYIQDLGIIHKHLQPRNDETTISNLLQTDDTDDLLKSLEHLLSKHY